MFCRCVFHVAQVLSSYFSSQSPVSFQSRDMKKIELDREHVRVFLENFQWQEHSDLTSSSEENIRNNLAHAKLLKI